MSGEPAPAVPAGPVDLAESVADARAPPTHDRRRVAANFLGMTATTGIGMAAGVLVSIYIRRTLGPDAFGQLSWSLAVLGYLGMIASPGLQVIGQLEIARDTGVTERLTSTVFSVQLALSVVAYAAVAVMALLDLRGPTVSLVLLLQGLSLFTTALDPGFVMQGRERMVAPAVATLILTLVQVPFLFWLVRGPGALLAYVGINLGFTAANLVYRLYLVHREDLLDLSRLRPSVFDARRLLSAAWPLALTQGAILIFYNCDTVILGFTHGDAAVGQYSSAYKLMLVSTAISGALCTAYFPSLGRAHQDPGHAATVAREFTSLLAWMGLPLTVLGWGFGRHVVRLLYGPAFDPASVYFEFLCLNIGLIYVNVALGTPLTAWGLQRLHLKITASGAVVNLVSNLILLPIYGPPAAIGTTIGTEIMITILVVTARWRVRLGWSPLGPLVLPPLAAVAAVAALLLVVPTSLDRYWPAELAVATGLLAAAALAAERRVVVGLWRQMRTRAVD